MGMRGALVGARRASRPFRRIPVPGQVRVAAAVMTATVRQYSADHCGVYAAAIAYYAIFSIVPMALITLSGFGFFADREALVDFVFEQVPLQETAQVRADVDAIVLRSDSASIAGLSIGLLTLLWSASAIFAAVRRGLDAAGHRSPGRAYWRGKLIDLALIAALGALITLSVGLTATVRVAFERAGDLGLVRIDTGLVPRLVALGLTAAVSFVLFVLLYRLVPTARPGWGEALLGAALATALFEMAKNGFAMVIGLAAFSREAALYAGLSTALLFLFWMYLNASILLLGSEFARVVVARRRGNSRAGGTVGEFLDINVEKG